MDARQLYAAQSGEEPEGAYELRARDERVTHYLAAMAARAGAPLRIAELSVGDGRLSAVMATLPRIGHLTCADISPHRLEQARARIGRVASRLEFVECDFDTEFHRLPDGGFDVVVALDILEHVFDVFGFLRHCARVLDGGGTLILRVPNIAYVRHRLRLLAGALPITASWFGPANDFRAWREAWGWDGGHLHLFTLPVVRRVLAEQGFAVEDCQDWGARWAAVRTLWPNLLYANPVFVARRLPR